MSAPALTKLTVCLDWTPNTNHIGFYVALQDGLYTQAGLEVELRSPDADPTQKLTPARQVAAGQAHFAVTPSESAISFATTDHEVAKLVAVAALVQGSQSAICTLKSSGIDRPAKLAGKRYASYDGRFEDPIVARMVANDGGDGGGVAFHSLDAHAYAEADTMGAGSVVATYLERGRSDSTWIFTAWEGVIASRAGQELNCFALEDYEIPYGYSPILLAHPDALSGTLADATRAFLAATAAGYRKAAADPKAGAAALCACGHASLADQGFVVESATLLAGKFLTPAGTWGTMELARWNAFVDFLAASHILTDRNKAPIARESIDAASLFTNEFLPA
jgi:ABC-type nitrate/sulfonate/bicarbonate transport system substrate-binding protein